MKKLLSFLIALSLCSGMAGCSSGSSSSSSQSAEPVKPAEGSVLTVYYLSDTPAAAQIVSGYKAAYRDVVLEATEFSNAEQMDVQIATETGSGKGPDVILFPKTTTLDTAKMSIGGTFMDLGPMLAQDEKYYAEDYYPILEAGKIDGRQTLMPLRFQCLYLLTSTEKKDATRLELSENYTMSELMQAMAKNAASCGDDASAMQILYPQTEGGLLYDNLRLTGVPIVDLKEETISVPDEAFREYADYTQMSYYQFEKSADILQAYSRDFVGAFSRLTAMMSNASLPYNLRYYQSIFQDGLGESMCVLFLPNYQDSNTLTADISLYAAVSQSTDQPQLAYEFVRFAMDAPVGDITDDLSINRVAVQKLLDDLSQHPGNQLNIGPKNVSIPAMSPELRTNCEEALNRISSGSIRNHAIESIFTNTMKDYIAGQAAFDVSYTNFKNQMGLYL